jgi:hypothetical protein
MSGTTQNTTNSFDGKPEWADHFAPDGRKFYCNAKLGKSSWKRPTELMYEKEKSDAW